MSGSPIHVHVQDNTPLHVHVKKPKKNEISKNASQRLASTNNARHSVRPGPRAKPKGVGEPWIPAPGKTSARDKMDKAAYKWDSGRAQLEINHPRVDVNVYPDDGETLRKSDLSSEEDNRLRSHITEYEKKIEGLMAEVGTLKNETKNLGQLVFDRSFERTSSPIKKIPELPPSNYRQESKEFPSAMFHGLPDPKQDYDESDRPGGYSFHSNCCAEWRELKPSEERVKRALNRLIKTAERGRKGHEKLVTPDKDIIAKLVDSSSNPTIFVDKSQRIDFENKDEGRELKESGSSSRSKVSFKSPLSDVQLVPESADNNKKSKETIVRDPSTMSYEEWGRSFGLTKADSSLELKQVEDELDKREEQLEASKMVLDDKQKELNYISKEFEETEKENQRLRKSMERYHDDLATSLKEIDDQTLSEDALQRQLIEVEVCGTEAGKQVAALRDVIKRLKYEKRLSSTDVNNLNKQRQLLLDRLDEFETSNRTVRRLLQKQHKTVSDVKRLEEQRDILMKKMADSDSDILRLRSELLQKKNDLEQLSEQVGEEKNHTKTLTELNKSVETTRAHLQRELRTKEMENNRLHVQLKNMERDSETIQREAEELIAAAKSEREALAVEKDGLKRAARSQRNRAERAEDALKEVEDFLADKERKLEEARSQADAWRERYQRASDEKANVEDHVQSLANRLAENESKARNNESFLRNKEDDLKNEIDRFSSENARCRSEVERFKSDAALAEERCRKAQQDASTLRSDCRRYESELADLRLQLRKAKNETEEALLTAEKVERSSRRMREDGTNEIERVRGQMLERMRDLQPLPELLKETEMKLQDAQDKLHIYEQRSAEQTRIIAELTNKSDDKSDEASTLRQRIAAMGDENRALEARLQILHVKLDDRDNRVKETVLDTANKDGRIQQLQLKAEELTHERDSLKRQLEAAVADTRKAVDAEESKAAAREHVSQSRIVDLETQITRLKTDIVSIKRSKEDAERRNQSKLQDARDRLEQAESTNRSMRNYVNFLKTSYNNVFGGDASLTSTPVRGGPSGGAHSPY